MDIPRISWIVLGISIIVTLIVWMGFQSFENQLQENEFNSKTASINQDISDRLQQYEQILTGAKGFLASNPETSAEDWKNYVDIQLISRYPDLQGLGLTKHVAGEQEVNNLITQMHDSGFEDFTIFPEGKRDEYYPVVFIEPLDVKNKRAIGYDTNFEEKRQVAISLAKETGKVVLSEKLVLVQEDETNLQNGFLLMMPIFTAEKFFSTDNDSSDFLGLVNAVFRINDFVEGLLGTQTFENLHMTIYDGSIDPENLFFDSNVFFEYDNQKMVFSNTSDLEFGNKTWILVYEGMPLPLSPVDGVVLTFLPIIGFTLSGLLFYMFFMMNKNLQLVKQSINTEKLLTVGKLAASLAHDLRTPLSTISGAMILLSHNSENLDEKNKNYISKSNTAVQRMNHPIDDVLNYVQTGELLLSEVSFNQIIHSPGVLPAIPSNIKLNLPYNDISFKCDSRKFELVMNNLILNAIQAIDGKSGTVTVRLNEDRKNVIIEVEDSGPGIPKNKLGRIFEPLYTTKYRGTGLGLASSEHIVNSHKGKISVSNNPTRFIILLPKK